MAGFDGGTGTAVDANTPPSGTYTVNGGLAITGAGGLAVGGVTAKKTTTYTATISDYFIPFDTSGGAFTITLPPANGRKGQMLFFKSTAVTANALTISRAGSDFIGVSGTFTITMTPSTVREGLLMINDGVTGWYQVCEFSAAL